MDYPALKLKLLSALFFLFLLGLTSQAQMLDKGTREFAISGNGDIVSGDVSLYLEPKFGYFAWDNVELGLAGSLNYNENETQVSIGPFAEYNFRTGSKWVPFVGGAVEWLNADIDIDSSGVETDSDGVGFDASLGLKYFLADNIAISTRYTHQWASDDLFTSADEVKDSAGFYVIGMRFYF